MSCCGGAVGAVMLALAGAIAAPVGVTVAPTLDAQRRPGEARALTVGGSTRTR